MDVDQVLVISSWGQKWLKFAWNRLVYGDNANRFATKILGDLDAVDEDPMEYVEGVVYTKTKTINHFKDGELIQVHVGEVERKVKRLKKGNRSKFSAAVAKLAYNKFGERPMSEANVLVTRRWLQKLLEEPQYADLRTVDKNLAIDRALFLSFVPTNSFRAMKLATSTRAWESRVENGGVFGGVFGKVFGIISRPKSADDFLLLE
nr:MAG: hypothetical protein [Tombusviridae sp.]